MQHEAVTSGPQLLMDVAGGVSSQAPPLQPESSGVSEASQAVDREQSAEDVLADILGGFASSPARPGRPAAISSGAMQPPLLPLCVTFICVLCVILSPYVSL